MLPESKYFENPIFGSSEIRKSENSETANTKNSKLDLEKFEISDIEITNANAKTCSRERNSESVFPETRFQISFLGNAVAKHVIQKGDCENARSETRLQKE